jgi:hypothetical protein
MAENGSCSHFRALDHVQFCVAFNQQISPFIPERTLKLRFAVLEDGKIPEHAALLFLSGP